jgi:hypothetical protein
MAALAAILFIATPSNQILVRFIFVASVKFILLFALAFEQLVVV